MSRIPILHFKRTHIFQSKLFFCRLPVLTCWQILLLTCHILKYFSLIYIILWPGGWSGLQGVLRCGHWSWLSAGLALPPAAGGRVAPPPPPVQVIFLRSWLNIFTLALKYFFSQLKYFYSHDIILFPLQNIPWRGWGQLPVGLRDRA